MQEYAEDSRFGSRQALCEKCSNDARKYVARTALGKAGVAGWNHVYASVGNRHIGGATLEDYRDAELRCKLLQVFRVETFVRGERTEVAFPFALVRRNDCVRRASVHAEEGGTARVDGVGVNDYGRLQTGQEHTDGVLRFGVNAESGADGNGTLMRGEVLQLHQVHN